MTNEYLKKHRLSTKKEIVLHINKLLTDNTSESQDIIRYLEAILRV